MTDFAYYTPENTSGHTRELLEGIRRNYGFVPNLFAYMAEAPTTIEAYLALNELVAKTSFTPAQQQVALLAVSVENNCSFCSIAHRAIGKMKGANPQTLDALTSGTEIMDPSDRALANFARCLTSSRGMPDGEDIQDFLDAGFSRKKIFEVILILTIKTLSNYCNHLTHPEPNEELLGML